MVMEKLWKEFCALLHWLVGWPSGNLANHADARPWLHIEIYEACNGVDSG